MYWMVLISIFWRRDSEKFIFLLPFPQISRVAKEQIKQAERTQLQVSIYLMNHLFNESIESRIVPDYFKISKVNSVFKTGAVTDLGNYRPIAASLRFLKSFYSQLNKFS